MIKLVPEAAAKLKEASSSTCFKSVFQSTSNGGLEVVSDRRDGRQDLIQNDNDVDAPGFFRHTISEVIDYKASDAQSALRTTGECKSNPIEQHNIHEALEMIRDGARKLTLNITRYPLSNDLSAFVEATTLAEYGRQIKKYGPSSADFDCYAAGLMKRTAIHQGIEVLSPQKINQDCPQ